MSAEGGWTYPDERYVDQGTRSAKVRAVSCPTCGAPARAYCSTRQGGVNWGGFHRARKVAASRGADDILACHGCGLPYRDPGWCDVVIPTEVWVQISPRGDEGGVLCLTCIARALVANGISDVPMQVTSGPWAWSTRQPPEDAS